MSHAVIAIGMSGKNAPFIPPVEIYGRPGDLLSERRFTQEPIDALGGVAAGEGDAETTLGRDGGARAPDKQRCCPLIEILGAPEYFDVGHLPSLVRRY
jgi:hypothetical protein